eukprot:gnl/MRDRNA2_/MRDRNA2_30449_c0_seq1.p1 gnl/MRDRNA2_/MRDRNA2_30449_c0~~gnl/MRDRNA2_/MRDRNA2_30449_c0_seq1.p1  ORF type:complete len:360 (+),score=53.60 gnl/MRDRNA2_/MRDRNA2_30449_c0_seq1:104-1183(+)
MPRPQSWTATRRFTSAARKLGRMIKERKMQHKTALNIDIPATMMARPLSEVLKDAGDAQVLRAQVAELEKQLKESQMERQLERQRLISKLRKSNEKLLAELTQERKRRIALENTLLGLEASPVNPANSTRAVIHACKFLDVKDVTRVSLACTQARIHSEEDRQLWQALCLRSLAAQSLVNCRNFKAALIAHRTLRVQYALHSKIKCLQERGRRIVHWTIASPRLVESMSSGNYIRSPSFTIGGVDDCCFFFYPRDPNYPRIKERGCAFCMSMPQGTIVSARVYVGKPHVANRMFTFQHMFGSDLQLNPIFVGVPDSAVGRFLEWRVPRLADNRSLEIQVDFEEIQRDGYHEQLWLSQSS